MSVARAGKFSVDGMGEYSGIESLVQGARRSLDDGAYDIQTSKSHHVLSLRKAILSIRRAPLITEVKFASPSKGKLMDSKVPPEEIAASMVKAGAAAISVLTQPKFFEGAIGHIGRVRKSVPVPILMKDIIVSKVQIEAGRRAGADCVLLIKSVFDRNLAEDDMETLYDFANAKELEVIVETHSESEYSEILGRHYPLVGINNRDLDTLKIDMDTTERLLKKLGKGKNSIILSESGISTPKEIRSLKAAGADAFLIGTSLIQSGNVGAKVKEMYEAI